ncbi:MAG: DUF3526 domain-containing protein [Ferruginibacter sp.]
MLLFWIIQKEWRELFRSKILFWLLTISLALSAFVVWNANKKFTETLQKRTESVQHMREKFLAQGAVNPHSAAHFGHFVYKPMNGLSTIDEGVNPFTGITLRLEAHQQNTPLFSSSQDESSLARFGQLRLSLLLQILLPLFILFVCHNAITKEKEAGTLKLAACQGISLRNLMWGKILAYSFIWWALLVVNFLLVVLIALPGSNEAFSIERLGSFLLLYGLYYFIITALSVYVSARSSSSNNALLLLLCGWLLCTVVLPKATANIGENIAPLITQQQMEKQINEDNKKGINGHDPRNERTKHFEDSVLKKYGVDTSSKLSVNLDGLTMQADEEYHNSIYDNHWGKVQNIIRKQNSITAYSSWINPFAGVRNISMGIAATDVYHHFDFTTQAEIYRRNLIRTLNNEMAYGGSKTGDWDWSVKADYWKKINDFRYSYPSIYWSVKNNKAELFALLFWLALTVCLIQFNTKKVSVL